MDRSRKFRYVVLSVAHPHGIQTGNVNDFLLEHYAKDKRLSELEIVLHTQVTCMF
jgi:hypothetical protein